MEEVNLDENEEGPIAHHTRDATDRMIENPTKDDEQEHIARRTRDATKPMTEKLTKDDEQEGPIARRTRGALKRLNPPNLINCIWKAILLIAIVFILPVEAKIGEDCNWIAGVPFKVPRAWNCDEILEQHPKLSRVAVHTRTHVRIPAIRCSNITRTVCTKAFLRLSLSVVSDQTTTTPTSSYFCKELNDQRKLNGSILKQVSHNKWSTNHEVQYSYGWFGVRCQSTTNIEFTNGELFLYDGKGLVSDLDRTEHCATQSGVCITNNSIVLWDAKEASSKCLYREIGT
ncbi:unnamed protein product [Onchocerca flexuosa]|uniref:C-type lectin domain-containing protein n=1 Tax=Onchocerca flexuosa TaxID=387005 RepID=A0A183HW77_9BILA|nr:unnamed protein product [Onchocerca flexuosa]